LLFDRFGVIHVMTAQSVAPRRKIMTTFTIDNDKNITAFASAEEAAAAASVSPLSTVSFSSQSELLDLLAVWPAEQVVAIWNSIPGVKAVERFKSAKAAASRIWERIQGLGEAAKPEEKPAKSKAAKKDRRPKARPPRARQPGRPPPPRARPRARKEPRRRKAPGRAKGARPPRWSPCSSARTALR
jgi:hypothetical protein